ncbi:MAG TPA: signal peptidase I [Longimicrobium sp.]|nr:signal peptidase I [Longimicrobium sp.]
MQDRRMDPSGEASLSRVPATRAGDERRATTDASRGSMSTGRWVWEWTKAISTAILLFLAVRTFLVEAFKIPTGSMEGTLLVGDFLLVNKAVYGAEIPLTHHRLPAFSDPQRGDVVVFLPPHDPHKNYVKRIVGVPGDTLEMRGKVLMRNGLRLDEPYVRHTDPLGDQQDQKMMWQLAFLADSGQTSRTYHPSRDNWGPLVVPAGKLFALGDNRDRSEDSRYWGFLEAHAVKGKPMFVYYSFQDDLLKQFDWLTGVRWRRIGEIIR